MIDTATPRLDAPASAAPRTGSHSVIREDERVGYLGLISRYRLSFVLCLVLCTAAGLGLGALAPVTYTSQGQMIAGATSVNAAAVPSFTQAGQALAQTYARVFTGDDVQRRLIAAGFDPATESATASPIASSSVILIESEAPTKQAALAATNRGIDALSTTVSGLLDNSTTIVASGDKLRAAYLEQAQASNAIDQLDKRNTSKASTTYERATARLGTAQAAVSAARTLLGNQVGNSVQSNGVRRLTSAHITSSTSAKRYEVGGALGLIAGVVLFTVVAFVRTGRRRTASLRRDAE